MDGMENGMENDIENEVTWLGKKLQIKLKNK